jgi:hypothetical protein
MKHLPQFEVRRWRCCWVPEVAMVVICKEIAVSKTLSGPKFLYVAKIAIGIWSI